MNLVEDDNKEFVKDYFADFKIAMNRWQLIFRI